MKIYHPLQIDSNGNEPIKKDFITVVNATYLFKFTFQDSYLITNDEYFLSKHRLDEIISKYRQYSYWFIDLGYKIISLLTSSSLVLKMKNIDTNDIYVAEIDLIDAISNAESVKDVLIDTKICLPENIYAGNWIYWFYGVTKQFSIYDGVIYFNKQIAVSDDREHILNEQEEFRRLFLYGSILIRN